MRPAGTVCVMRRLQRVTDWWAGPARRWTVRRLAHDLAVVVLFVGPAMAGTYYHAHTMRHPVTFALAVALVASILTALFTGPSMRERRSLIRCPHCQRLHSVTAAPDGEVIEPGDEPDRRPA
jgi:hypothetical protein